MVRVQTLYELFPEQSRESIDCLIDDPDFEKQIPDLILSKVQKSQGRIIPVEKEMEPLFFTKADFADTQEAYEVVQLFYSHFSTDKRFLPRQVDYLQDLEETKSKRRLSGEVFNKKAEDFAARCLFSLSLFYPALKRLHDKHAAPHPRYYRELGKRMFDDSGHYRISLNFENWGSFIREEAFV